MGMTERPSGFTPENIPEPQSKSIIGDEYGDIEAVYQRLSPEELARINQAAEAVAAAMEDPLTTSWLEPSADTDTPTNNYPPASIYIEAQPEAIPVWGVEPLDMQLMPNEAPSLRQREHARHYLLILVSLAERRYRYEETLPDPEELLEAYAVYSSAIELENQNLPPQERLPAFTPTHLWAAARRQNSWVAHWLEEQYGDAEPEEFIEALLITGHIERGLAEAVRMLE
jgi:hypothetical protein